MANFSNIKPYNDLWLDCIKNNLISMLMCTDEKFKDIIFHAEVTYHNKIIDQKFNYDGEEEKFYVEGFFTPKVMFFMDFLDQLFEKKELSFNEYNPMFLYDFIKKAINDGYGVFLKIDRFFYFDGREAGKYHMEHPVFIYGYDPSPQIFKTIEDCRIPGTMQYYDLPYSVIKASCEDFISHGKNIEVVLYKPNNNFDLMGKREVSLLQAKKMCNNLLTHGGLGSEYNLLYEIGLAGIKTYGKNFVDLFSKIEEFGVFKTRVAQFQQFHIRNVNLIKLLNEYGYINDQDSKDLCNRYEQIRSLWGSFKQKSYQIIARKKLNICTSIMKDELISLSMIIGEIVKYESEATNKMLKVLP
ncbi:hypothetical protein NYE24_15790 [Paenibacillus sp. FSL H7-0350]|uniref:hypothetical protein n=1 Tax=Paenibacillus sp. FSL H7-0350 TaxID=2975345 RepID=UPI0031599120